MVFLLIHPMNFFLKQTNSPIACGPPSYLFLGQTAPQQKLAYFKIRSMEPIKVGNTPQEQSFLLLFWFSQGPEKLCLGAR